MQETNMARFLTVFSLALIFLALCIGEANAESSELEAVDHLKRRKCSRFCFVGRNARRQARRNCQRKFAIQRCRKRGFLRRRRSGFRCTCRPRKPKKSPSPSPIPKKQALLLVEGTSNTTNIVDCTSGELFIQVQDPSSIVVDDFIWSVPQSGSDICSGCNSVARKVVAVNPATTFGSSSCPAGDPCVEVTTVDATVSELFASAILKAFDISPLADEPLEPLFGCSLPINRRTLNEKLSIRQGSRVPTTCDGFSQADADGRCTFSDCIIGTNGNPVDCLFCMANCDNGCGPDDPTLNALIPESIQGVFDFGKSCCIHDKCYTSLFSKVDCDRAFLRDNLASCIDDISLFIPLPILGIASIARCPIAALIYYIAVDQGGGQAYADAQARRLTYEASDECAAQCPTTQRSGGRGTTRLTVDLMKTSGTFEVSYNMFSIPDGLEITYEGNVIFTTGGLVSGSATVPITYSGSSTLIQATLSAPNQGTAWTLSIACPP